MADLDALRASYRRGELVEEHAPPEPWTLFEQWLTDALEAGVTEPNAMTLATVDEAGHPHARTVLLKGLSVEGDTRMPQFFSNLESAKARHLGVRPACALLFTWLSLERQVRIEGAARRLDADREDDYFASRPRGSQIGAWASEQSRVVGGREELERAFAKAEQRFDGGPVPRPAGWGGWGVEVECIEFWQGRENRLHDRLRYRRREGHWHRERLAP